MNEIEYLSTDRLSLVELNPKHSAFMFQLVNTPKWKEFIGDRNIQNEADADRYIQKIVKTPNLDYWVIQLKENDQSIGIISFMKRDYLEHFDIGFALLPEAFGKGIAFEATSAVLANLKKNQTHETILATTVPSNISSIELLKKLGFSFLRKIESNNESLHVYSLFLT